MTAIFFCSVKILNSITRVETKRNTFLLKVSFKRIDIHHKRLKIGRILRTYTSNDKSISPIKK